MISVVLFLWIGAKLEASVWYYILTLIGFTARIFDAYRYATRKKRETAQNSMR